MSNYPAHETLTPYPPPPDPREQAARELIEAVRGSYSYMWSPTRRKMLEKAAVGLERVLGGSET